MDLTTTHTLTACEDCWIRSRQSIQTSSPSRRFLCIHAFACTAKQNWSLFINRWGMMPCVTASLSRSPNSSLLTSTSIKRPCLILNRFSDEWRYYWSVSICFILSTVDESSGIMLVALVCAWSVTSFVTGGASYLFQISYCFPRSYLAFSRHFWCRWWSPTSLLTCWDCLICIKASACFCDASGT